MHGGCDKTSHMTKTSAFIIITAVLLSALNAFATEESQYARGLILAVDTRDHRVCEVVEKTVQSMTKSDVSHVCAQDGRNPYAVAIITVPINEFDFMSEVNREFGEKQQLATINNPQLGSMFILPREKYTDQYFRVVSRRDKANITIFRQADFGDMDFRRERSLMFSFVLKSNSSQHTSKKIASSVAKKLIFNRGSIEMNEAQYRSQATKAAGIMDSINGAIQDAINSDRASFGLFMPPKNCREQRPCPREEGYGLGLKIIIRF